MSDGQAALAELGRIGVRSWLVGGAVRDRWLGRATSDFDVSVAGAPEPVARELARRARGHAFRLSEAFGAWRVVDRDGAWQVDLLPLAGSLEEDLAARDLTVNAIAEPLGGGDPVDPFGGLEDLRRGLLRPVSASAFERDPLRTLRLVRLAGELDLRPGEEALGLAARSAPGLARVAGERVFAELRRIIVSDRVLDGLALMSSLGLTAQVLPELEALRGVEQNRYHHLDVHDHTLAVLGQVVELAHDPAAVFGQDGTRLREVLDEPLADELSRGQALRFGALFHDLAKPLTRGQMADGRVTFIGHDVRGAALAEEVLRRLRASARLGEHVAALTRHHLDLGFLVHHAPLDRRRQYRYLRGCAPVEVDVTVLSAADRLATLGDGAEAAVERHLELARQVMPAALEWHARPPRPPLRGDELMATLGLAPGPELGAVLAELEEAAYAGEASTPEAALALARRLAAGETR